MLSSKKQPHTKREHILDVIRDGERIQYGNLCDKLREKGYPVRGLYSALNKAGCVRVGRAGTVETELVERPPWYKQW